MQKFAHLVELEKFCQTHIFLQKFVLIQPRTSPPKICKIILENAGAGAAPALVGIRGGHFLADLVVDEAAAQTPAGRAAVHGVRGSRVWCCTARDRANFRGLVLGYVEAD